MFYIFKEFYPIFKNEEKKTDELSKGVVSSLRSKLFAHMDVSVFQNCQRSYQTIVSKNFTQCDAIRSEQSLRYCCHE